MAIKITKVNLMSQTIGNPCLRYYRLRLFKSMMKLIKLKMKSKDRKVFTELKHNKINSKLLFKKKKGNLFFLEIKLFLDTSIPNISFMELNSAPNLVLVLLK
jgi:hypothetical protein